MRKDRLLQLAEHLETGKLGHEYFDFSAYNYNHNPYEVVTGECGTAGCALGECPIIWPEDWVFCTRTGFPILDQFPYSEPINCASIFFEISDIVVIHLFKPLMQLTGKFGGVVLPNIASKEQVASNIRAFVEKCG